MLYGGALGNSDCQRGRRDRDSILTGTMHLPDYAGYSRLVAESVAELASEVVDNAEKANSIYPSDETRKELRKQHLLESRAALMALDVHLAHCYELMMLNPAGCFTKSNGDNVSSADAKKKLEHMSQELGELIDAENAMLTNVLKSDKGR